MPQEPAQPVAGRGPPDQVRARVAATYQFLARSRQRAAFAMAHVRYIDLLLHSSSGGGRPADPDLRPGLLRRAEQLRAESLLLREQVATVAEEVAAVEEQISRVHRTMADQGGPLAEQARDRANRAEALAAKERAEAERLRGPG